MLKTKIGRNAIGKKKKVEIEIERDGIAKRKMREIARDDTGMMQEKEKTPTAFSLTRINNRSFFFENPSHDYPKRIVYELISKDSLHAWIDGGEHVKDSRVDFYFRRMQ